MQTGPDASANRPARSPRVVGIGYLGWTGFGNMGDEAIAGAIRIGLPEFRFDPLPLGPGAVAGAAVRCELGRWSDDHLFLGGGTVLGRRIWRVHLALAHRLARRAPSLMLGAGVEDPAFQRRHWLSERGELRWWPSVLRRFDRVTVRGPRSAELLASIGINADVVGDPALLHRALATREPGLVGIALGCSDDLWGHDQPAVVEQVASVAAFLVRRDHHITFISANPSDVEGHRRCAALAGLRPGEHTLVKAWEPSAFLAAAARCQVMLAERLHAGVLSAACGVPVVMLEYQPKCLDFMASIGASQRSVRTDRIDVGDLHDLVAETASDATVVALQERAVEILRGRLLTAVGEARSVLQNS